MSIEKHNANDGGIKKFPVLIFNLLGTLYVCDNWPIINI